MTNTSITPSSTVEVEDKILSRTVREEQLILSLERGEYFGLDDAGSLIWDKVQKGARVKEIIDAVVEDYDVNPEQAEKDTLALLETLAAKKLILVTPGA